MSQSLLPQNYKGYFLTEAALVAAIPNGLEGYWAQVEDVSAIFIWNVSLSAWKNTADSGISNDKGYFVDQAALEAAYPIGEAGWFAIVGSTDTVWTWDSGTSAWVNTGASGASSFTEITSGTNTSAAMVVGSGSSLTAGGSGTITATAVPASGITGTTLASGITASSLTSLGTLGALTIGGNQTFSGTARRIIADLSNATRANRLAFQDATTNNSSGIGILPNGTATTASWFAYAGSDADNAPFGQFHAASDHVGINSSKTGTGTTQPIAFQIDNVTKVSVDTSGNLNVANLTASTVLVANGSKNIASSAATSSEAVLGDGTGKNLSNGSGNLSASSPYNCSIGIAQGGQWSRVGNIVTATASLDITPTSTGACSFKLYVPVSSNISSADQASGIISGPTISGYVWGDSLNTVSVNFEATGISVVTVGISFQYQVV